MRCARESFFGDSKSNKPVRSRGHSEARDRAWKVVRRTPCARLCSASSTCGHAHHVFDFSPVSRDASRTRAANICCCNRLQALRTKLAALGEYNGPSILQTMMQRRTVCGPVPRFDALEVSLYKQPPIHNRKTRMYGFHSAATPDFAILV
jgi:hypothetical protein